MQDWTEYPVTHFDMSRCKREDVAMVSQQLKKQISDFEKQYGCCDVVLKSSATIYVLVLKVSSKATVDDALAQIDEKNYLIPFWNDPRRKVKVGVTVNPEERTIKEWKVVE